MVDFFVPCRKLFFSMHFREIVRVTNGGEFVLYARCVMPGLWSLFQRAAPQIHVRVRWLVRDGSVFRKSSIGRRLRLQEEVNGRCANEIEDLGLHISKKLPS